MPESTAVGRQTFAVVAHLPLVWHGAPPQSAALAHVHCPLFWSQASEGQSAFAVQEAASAQLPPWGGYAAVGDLPRAPIHTGWAQ